MEQRVDFKQYTTTQGIVAAPGPELVDESSAPASDRTGAASGLVTNKITNFQNYSVAHQKKQGVLNGSKLIQTQGSMKEPEPEMSKEGVAKPPTVPSKGIKRMAQRLFFSYFIVSAIFFFSNIWRVISLTFTSLQSSNLIMVSILGLWLFIIISKFEIDFSILGWVSFHRWPFINSKSMIWYVLFEICIQWLSLFIMNFLCVCWAGLPPVPTNFAPATDQFRPSQQKRQKYFFHFAIVIVKLRQYLKFIKKYMLKFAPFLIESFTCFIFSRNSIHFDRITWSIHIENF